VSQERIVQVLTRALGLDPGSLGPAALARAVATRMRAARASDSDAYLALVQRSRSELDALIEEVVVRESWFLRDAHAFRVLAGWALRRPRASGSEGAPIRILSLPCAGGEEPFSVVICLVAAGLAPERIRVRAIDVSARAIAAAKRGVFGEQSFRGMGAHLRERFFARVGSGYRIDPRLQACVDFEVANAFDPALALGERCFDAIFCRNLLIYLDPASRRRLLDRLERALASHGMLFAGHAEDFEAIDPRLRRTSDARAFAFVLARDAPSRAQQTDAVPTCTRERSAALAVRGRVVDSGRGERRPGAGRASTEAASAAPPHACSRGEELRAAQQASERAIASGAANADVYCLLGVALHGQARLAEARASFEKALYLDRHHYETLVHLALLCDASGDEDEAARLRRRAGRVHPVGAGP